MELRTKADIRLLGRAMREDWPTSAEVKAEAIQALLEIVRLKDPELTIEAVKVLVKADESNQKAQALLAKQEQNDSARRIKLLELARLIPVGEITAIASSDGSGLPSPE